ncbi:MAG: metal ABC transporter ATP-binding protein [Bacteroidales bacterium]|nr:metal ABC transporter ATP-binding protein [Bacteroidales bacterium]
MMNNKLVEISGVHFSYNSSPLLTDINLCIREGDFVGVVGANGSGKTTLVKLLLGHLVPQKGTVRYYSNGESVAAPSIGYLPQYSAVDKRFPLSVREVVETGLLTRRKMWGPIISSDDRRRVDATLEQMGLSRLSSVPIGNLSGGELQKTILARAIVSSPRLLLLDEPDTYLDSCSQERLYELLKEINKNCAILLVSHDVSTVSEKCNFVVSVNRTLRVQGKK